MAFLAIRSAMANSNEVSLSAFGARSPSRRSALFAVTVVVFKKCVYLCACWTSIANSGRGFFLPNQVGKGSGTFSDRSWKMGLDPDTSQRSGVRTRFCKTGHHSDRALCDLILHAPFCRRQQRVYCNPFVVSGRLLYLCRLRRALWTKTSFVETFVLNSCHSIPRVEV